MRAYFTILVAALALLASSGVVPAASVSSPANAEHTATHYVENEANRGRFLRKRLEDESEERGALMDAAKKAKQYVNGEQKLAKLFKKTDEQLFKKSIRSEYLTKGVARLEKAGWPAAKVEKFKAIAERYSKFQTAKSLQNYKLNFEHV
ncbi:hypothetical protein V7S43_010730 [Phytophthora oleae]|uniref:RxLR effector protein n=1 Tax=Phytophthora oleae TaxID=2107226 RepID=A0ABD3FD98_9STRA